MSDFSSSSAFEKKTLVGVWSIPGQRRKCYGTLHFELDGEQKLSIIGDLGDFDYSHFSRLPEFDQNAGASGFLIGETLMRAADPGAKLKELLQCS